MEPSTTRRNIREICKIENEALERRSVSDRIGDRVAAQAGQMWFLIAHGIWFLLWIVYNGRIVPRLHAFDPYPFSLLTMVVSLESIFLSLFILMSQSRANRQADERNHLDLQINLLSEHESTKTLQMLQALCAHHGLKIANDPEITDLARRTEPRQLLKELRANLPEPE
jgi:uncharacterized membrane protein